jgi:hypothetical protein
MMMTPKEKAVKLIEKFSRYTEPSDCNHEALQCALIAVTEIENALIEYGEATDELQNMDRELNYWNEVRYEIEKL